MPTTSPRSLTAIAQLLKSPGSTPSPVPVVRAQLALNRGEPVKALEVLVPGSEYELGWTGAASAGFAGSLYPIYMRGQAFLADNQAAKAAAEFQSVIANIGVLSNEPTVVALARINIARAYKKAGNVAQAREAYETFLNLWKTADREVPLYKQAVAEFAGLR